MVVSTYISSGLLLSSLVGISFLKRLSRKAKKPEHLYTEALHCLIRDDKHNAVSLLREVVKKDSDHVDAYLLLGNTIRDEFPEQAVKIHQSLTVRPGLSKTIIVEIHKSLAEDYHTLNKIDLAKRECEKILKLERRNKWAVELLLILAETERDWKKAEHWDRLLKKISGKRSSSDPEKYHIHLGKDKLNSRDLSGAESEFKNAVKINSDSPHPYYFLGKIDMENGKKEAALHQWKQYLTLTPNPKLGIYKEIEGLLFEFNRYSEIEGLYRKIVEKYPQNKEALVRMVNHLIEKGDRDKAQTFLEQLKEESLIEKLLKHKISLPEQTDFSVISGVDSLIKFSLESDQ